MRRQSRRPGFRLNSAAIIPGPGRTGQHELAGAEFGHPEGARFHVHEDVRVPRHRSEAESAQAVEHLTCARSRPLVGVS